MTRLLAIVVLLAAVSWPAVASARVLHEDEVPMDHPGRRHAMHPNLMGSKLGYVSLFAPSAEGGYEHVPLGYAGLFYERSIVHEWLEIELTVAAAAGTEELALPVDLYFKKPFHPSSRFTLYVGAGPHLDLLVRPERRLLVGACVTAGTYIWFSERWGMDVDLDYAVAAGGGQVFHDVLVATGPTVRF
ncbi:MAG: hypothetical protein AB1Z98_32725 [Nannocystaceae bacterium]